MASTPTRDATTEPQRTGAAGSTDATVAVAYGRRERWLGGDSVEQVIALVCLGALIEVCLAVLTHRKFFHFWIPGRSNSCSEANFGS